MDLSDLGEQLAANIERLEVLLDKLPAPVAASLRADVQRLRELILQQRPPRILLSGPPDSDKTPLIAALLDGAPTEISTWTDSETGLSWRRFGDEQGAVDVTDTRRNLSDAADRQLARQEADLQLDAVLHTDPDALRDHIIKSLPGVAPQARLQLARLVRIAEVQREAAGDVTRVLSSISAGVAAVPIPVADIAPLTGLQVGLVASIAYISGREMNLKNAAEFVGAMGVNVGAAFVFRELARAVSKVVAPGAGSLVSAGIGWAGTRAIGAAATAYFVDRASKEEARRQFEVTVKEPRKLQAPDQPRSPR